MKLNVDVWLVTYPPEQVINAFVQENQPLNGVEVRNLIEHHYLGKNLMENPDNVWRQGTCTHLD